MVVWNLYRTVEVGFTVICYTIKEDRINLSLNGIKYTSSIEQYQFEKALDVPCVNNCYNYGSFVLFELSRLNCIYTTVSRVSLW